MRMLDMSNICLLRRRQDLEIVVPIYTKKFLNNAH